MNREKLRESLLLLIKNKFRLSVEHLEDHLRLKEDLRIDSIMIVQLIVFIELDLKLQVPDHEVDPRAFMTVGSLLDFMQGLERLDHLEHSTDMKASERL